jgi:hypothetical protein
MTRVVPFLALAIVLGCTDDSPADLSPAPADGHARGELRIGNKSMGPHADTVGATMRQPLVVMVVDPDGVPVRGVPVRWEAFDGAGVSAAEMPTDAGGESEVRLVLGRKTALYRARATVHGMTGSPVEFAATAHPGTPVSAVKHSGDSLAVDPGGRVVLTVRVRDRFGNGVHGVRIEWKAEGGGMVSWPLSFTNKSGDAEVVRTLGPSAAPQHTVAVLATLGDSTTLTFTTFTRIER